MLVRSAAVKHASGGSSTLGRRAAAGGIGTKVETMATLDHGCGLDPTDEEHSKGKKRIVEEEYS